MVSRDTNFLPSNADAAKASCGAAISESGFGPGTADSFTLRPETKKHIPSTSPHKAIVQDTISATVRDDTMVIWNGGNDIYNNNGQV